MDCKYCGYYWAEEGNKYCNCHYEDDGFLAPCEEEVYRPRYTVSFKSATQWEDLDFDSQREAIQKYKELLSFYEKDKELFLRDNEYSLSYTEEGWEL